MKDDVNLFWERVDKLWRELGITRQEFCNSTNGKINFYTWSNKKSQGKAPNLELASAFAKALNTSIDYLVTGQEYQDELFAKLQNDKELKETCSRISLCSEEHLSIINTMLASWGYIVSDENQTKGLA